MPFRISGLSAAPFHHLYGLNDLALKEFGVVRYQAKENSGFPDRIEMRDALPGETVLLLNHVYQPEETPFKASHAIFVREGAYETYDRIDEIPPVMKTRLLSLRGFDEAHMMVEADVVEGRSVTELIEHLFSNPDIAYIHAHNARQGCFAGRVDRVQI